MRLKKESNTSRVRFLLMLFLLLFARFSAADFTTVSVTEWDNTAVRKVLQTFAYGGFASDSQIDTWAGMTPSVAIAEILTFDPTNNLLSPAEDITPNYLSVNGQDRTLTGLQALWASSSVDNLTRTDVISKFDEVSDSNTMFRPSSLPITWVAAVNKRGVNTFRQKIGFWLTNYLMSTHLSATGNNIPQVRTMYDEAMATLAIDAYLADTLTSGATSAAIATQYGHRSNTFNSSNMTFSGNDDFAREYHQLFFGILGELPPGDPNAQAYKDYYEDVTVENTAIALTGMQIDRFPVASFSPFADFIDFNSTANIANHHAGPLEILNFDNQGIANISGVNALEKISALSLAAINTPESEANLPVMIISHFADDTLDPLGTDQRLGDIREGWISANKNLLSFLQAYAISTTFHDASRIKFQTAFDRNLEVFNKNTVDNVESYQSFVANDVLNQMVSQGADPFRPVRFVFGGQTGRDAIGNPDLFKRVYNTSVDKAYTLLKPNDSTTGWMKDWGKRIPADNQGNYRVGDVATWLWNHFMSDGGANYGPQENAYITALLATGQDFLIQVDSVNPVVDGYADSELQTDPILTAIIQANENSQLLLNDAGQQFEANRRVGLAVNFIAATPFIFTQEGK